MVEQFGRQPRSASVSRAFATRLAAFLTLFITLQPGSPARALDQVSLQLKWRHQFQFAGYYAAIEKGFYHEHGLEVEIREGGPGVDAGTEIAYGAADFAVCTTSVLTNRIERDNNVVIGVIFQHSAAIVMVPYRAGIHTISELKRVVA
jgi:ABC-type nitrate/sulfonate/bicarbonate transport system substrate-binding protein